MDNTNRANGAANSQQENLETSTVDPDDQGVRIDKWIKLLTAFNSVYSERKPELLILEDLKLRGISVEIKSEEIDGRNETTVHVENLISYSCSGSYREICKIEAMALTIEYLVHLRNLINDFKTVTKASKYNTELMITKLKADHPKMVQIEEKTGETEPKHTRTIAITNLASVSESASNAEQAFKDASFKICEYLRYIAQIGHLELIDILLQRNESKPAGGGSPGNSPKPPSNGDSDANHSSQTQTKQVDNFTESPNRSQQQTDNSSINPSRCSQLKSTTNETELTIHSDQTMNDVPLADQSCSKWASLIYDFNLACSIDGKWQLFNELRNRGHQIHVLPFTVEDDHYAMVQIEGLARLTKAKGKDKRDACNNALIQMIAFLSDLSDLTKQFRSVYSTAKSPLEIIESLDSRNELISISSKLLHGKEWSSTIELKNVTSFNATASDILVANSAAALKLVDYLKQMCHTTQSIVAKIPDEAAYFATKCESHHSSSDKLSNATPQVERFIHLIDIFKSVSQPGKSKMQIIWDFNGAAKPSIQIKLTRISLPGFVKDISHFQASTRAEIIFHRYGKKRIVFESSPEEIVDHDPDAVSKLIEFLNNLVHLLKNVQSKPLQKLRKYPVKQIYALMSTNENAFYISSCNDSTIVEIVGIASFSEINEEPEVSKHDACSRAMTFLCSLAQIDLSEHSNDQDQCQCKMPHSDDIHSPVYYQSSDQQNDKMISQSPNYTDTLIENPSKSQQSTLVSKLQQLIASFNRVKSAGQLLDVDKFNAISEIHVNYSKEVRKAKVTIDDVFSYAAYGKDENQCKFTVLSKATRFLNNLSNLAANFMNEVSNPFTPSALIDQLIPRNYEMIKMIQFENEECICSTSILVANVAKFTETESTFEESKQNSSKKAIDFLRELVSTDKLNFQSVPKQTQKKRNSKNVLLPILNKLELQMSNEQEDNTKCQVKIDSSDPIAHLQSIIRLIGDIKTSDYDCGTLDKLKARGVPIRISMSSVLESTILAKERIFTCTVEFENLLSFKASSKQVSECQEEAKINAVKYLRNMAQLVQSFISLHSSQTPTLDIVDRLADQSSELLSISTSTENDQNSVTISIVQLANFVENGPNEDNAKQLAAEKAVEYLTRLAQITA